MNNTHTGEDSRAQAAPRSVNAREVQAALKNTDWDGYWSDVHKRASERMGAYAVARARSLDTASRRVSL